MVTSKSAGSLRSYPGAGNTILFGTNINVEWTYPGTSQVHVFLYHDENYVLTIGSWLVNDGLTSWTIPSNLSASNCYRIVVGVNNLGGNPGTLPNSNWGSGYIVGAAFTLY